MNVIGLFRELSREIHPSAPSIHTSLGILSTGQAVEAATYLRQGTPFFDVMEATLDPVDKTSYISGGRAY